MLDEFLSEARAVRGASSLVVSPFGGALLHIAGRPRSFDKFSGADCTALSNELVESLEDDYRMQLDGRGDVTVRLSSPRYGIVRAHLYRSSGAVAVAFRFHQEEAPRFETLGWPAAILDWTKVGQGFVPITGPLDSGKTTLLASLVRSMAEVGDRVIWVIESPQEYAFRAPIVSHISVGPRADAATYSDAVRSALRAQAKVIVIGEMFVVGDDGEIVAESDTIGAAFKAADAGALVFGTLHAPSLANALERMIDAFPVAQERRYRRLLADYFVGGAGIRLIPRQDGDGVVCASEIVTRNDAIREMILRGDVSGLRNVVMTSEGMHTLESQLQTLVDQRSITAADARLAAARPSDIVG